MSTVHEYNHCFEMNAEDTLMQKLASISDRFQEVEKQVGDPEVIADQRRYRDLMRDTNALGQS